MKTRTSGSGFTLVELLIVIVVIAILAAIAAVGYNGIQSRAYASKAATTADTYLKALEMYKINNGKYPSFSDLPSGAAACLSATGSLPADAMYAVNQCDTGFFVTARISPELNAKLQPYMTTLPSSLLPSVNYGTGRNMRAIVYAPQSDVNPALNHTRMFMYYQLKGSFSCPRASETDSWFAGTTACEYE